MTISEYLKKKEKLNEERIQLEEKLRKNNRKERELIQALHQGNKSEYMKNLKGSKVIEPGGDVISFKSLKTEKPGKKYAGTSAGAPNDKVFVVRYLWIDKDDQEKIFEGCMDLDVYLERKFYWKRKLILGDCK